MAVLILCPQLALYLSSNFLATSCPWLHSTLLVLYFQGCASLKLEQWSHGKKIVSRQCQFWHRIVMIFAALSNIYIFLFLFLFLFIVFCFFCFSNYGAHPSGFRNTNTDMICWSSLIPLLFVICSAWRFVLRLLGHRRRFRWKLANC